MGEFDGGSQLTPFGAEMREKHFLFDKDYVNLNHGSFGTYPAAVGRRLRALQDAAEARPDDFIRHGRSGLLDGSRGELARLLGVPADEVVLVPNATTGVNTVLRNLVFAAGDAVVYFSSIYAACEKTVAYLCESTPVVAERIEVVYPLEDAELVGLLRGRLGEVRGRGGRPRVVLFDTVVSMPGVRVPFEALTEVVREEGCLSLIDGAHGVGHISLDLGKLDADFFVSNCHKWLFTPRGCAVLHVPQRNQHLIRSTLPTSHGFIPLPSPTHPTPDSPLPPSSNTPFVANFDFVGTTDCTPYLCIPAALSFRRDVCGGEERIIQYCTRLAHDAGRLVADTLGTEVLDNKTGTMTRCCFANVKLPLEVGTETEKGQVPHEDIGRVTAYMIGTFVDDYNTFMAVVFSAGSWWVRLSAQVYLELKDFEWSAGVLKEVCERVKNREYLVRVGKARLLRRKWGAMYRGTNSGPPSML